MALLTDLNYPNASQAAKSQQQHVKRVEKVVKGNVRIQKPSLGRRLADAFIGPDITDVKKYLFDNVLIPTLKNTVLDSLSSIFYGRPYYNNTWGRGNATVTAYNRIATGIGSLKPQNQPLQRDISPNRPSYDNFIFETLGEAEDVLRTLLALLEASGSVSLNDLYDAVGITAPFTDVYLGWTDLSTATTAPARRGGWALILPKPKRIDP